MNITCVEIENPYRYRAYCVGKKPMYDIQNFSLLSPSDSIVKSIFKDERNHGDPKYIISMNDGERIIIESGSLIIHQKWTKHGKEFKISILYDTFKKIKG